MREPWNAWCSCLAAAPGAIAHMGFGDMRGKQLNTAQVKHLTSDFL
jgi:hypothetical protein